MDSNLQTQTDSRNESKKKRVVSLLDYGAGNVRSVRNAIRKLGYEIKDIVQPEDITNAEHLIFPGVGSFGAAMSLLEEKKFLAPLKAYLEADKPFFGICIGMQVLFEASTETGRVTPTQRRALEKQAGGDDGKGGDNDNGADHDASPVYIKGLGVIPGTVEKFTPGVSVPHIGWNGVRLMSKYKDTAVGCDHDGGADNRDVLYRGTQVDNTLKYYFVHSYRALVTQENAAWVCTSTDYGKDTYISSIARGNVFACQYHPEKSAERGLQVIGNFLSFCFDKNPTHAIAEPPVRAQAPRVAGAAGGERDGEKAYRDGRTALSKRIIACLDVRCNDAGDLVVTKGDQYDVREEEEKTDAVGQRADAGGVGDGFANKGKVRNLGKPVELASRYYREGADEVTFLNITSFREGPITDAPMFGVLQEASKEVFVPLTIGGGIRDYTDPLSGQTWTALDVASMYFRAGADKVSIGSDAVYAAERYYTHGGACEGASAIEQISQVYGAQAVVVSVDPKRVYVQSPEDTEHFTINVEDYAYDCDEQGVPRDMHGPKGEKFCWYQCTVRGGREGRDMDAHQLAKAVQALGAGELLVNSIDNDGCKAGFDIGLIDSISKQVSIPVIASSGAGRVQHFSNLFQHTDVQAGLAAGIFHRREVPISRVKAHLEESDIQIRK